MKHKENPPILESRSEPCSNCGKVTQVVYFFNNKKNNLCDACELELKNKTSKDLMLNEKKTRIDIKKALKKINVNFNSDVKLVSHNNLISEIQNNLKQVFISYQKGFYLFGVAGCGKTTNMQVFAHYLIYTPIKNNFRPLESFLFKTESKLIAEIFATAKDDFDWNFQLAINSHLKNVKFLFIDELAAKHLSEYELQIIDLIIHHVEEHKNEMRLFVTSNKAIEELNGHYLIKNDQNFADRIVSRLYSLTTAIKLAEKDYRKLN